MKPGWVKFVKNYIKPSMKGQDFKIVSFTGLEENDNNYTGWFYVLGDNTKKIYEIKLENNKVVFLRDAK